MKTQLIQFLKGRSTTFSVDEVNQMISIISRLEEPKEEESKDTKKK